MKLYFVGSQLTSRKRYGFFREAGKKKTTFPEDDTKWMDFLSRSMMPLFVIGRVILPPADRMDQLAPLFIE